MATRDNKDLAMAFAASVAGRVVYEESTDTFWAYADHHWSPLSVREMQNEISAFVSAADPENRQTMGKIDDIRIQTMFHVKRSSDLGDRFLAFDDGHLDMMTLELVPHDPLNVATVRIKHDYAGPPVPTPVFDKYLLETCVDEEGQPDPGMMRWMQECAGYVLSPSTKAELCFFLYGTGGNGKSPFIDVLRAMVSPERCSASQLRKLTTDSFELSKLVGKRLNASTELDNRGFDSETFKNIVSGEMVSAARKYGAPFDFRPRCKFIISTNEIPAFKNVGAAILRRAKVITFNNKVDLKTKDVHLADKIIAGEMPGVIRWAVEGLRRMMANNWNLSDSASGEHGTVLLAQSSSTALAYIVENYEPDANASMSGGTMYQSYKEWCKDNGHEACSSTRFGKEAALKFGKARQLWLNGKNTKVYSCREKTQPF